MSKRELYSSIGRGIGQVVQWMSKNKVWLTEYRLWKAAHDCIDMSQEENRNITPLLWLEITELDDNQVSKLYLASS